MVLELGANGVAVVGAVLLQALVLYAGYGAVTRVATPHLTDALDG